MKCARSDIARTCINLAACMAFIKTPHSSKIEIAHSPFGKGGSIWELSELSLCMCVCKCVCVMWLCLPRLFLPKQVNAVSGHLWHLSAKTRESSHQTPPPGLLSARGFWGTGDPVRLQFFSCRAWRRPWSSCCTSSRLSSTRWRSIRTATVKTRIWGYGEDRRENSNPHTDDCKNGRNNTAICSPAMSVHHLWFLLSLFYYYY